MMGSKSLSPEKVAYLWLLLNEKKWNVTEIFEKLKISRSCIYTYKKRGMWISGVHKKKNRHAARACGKPCA